MEKELDDMIESLDAEIESFEVKSLMRGEDDFRDAQVEIAAGAGGRRRRIGRRCL
jgi:peptide chain release factor 2